MRRVCTLFGVLALACAPAIALAKGDSHGTSGQGGSGQAASHSQGTSGTSGTYTSPQPTSTADQNSGGANGGCPGTKKGDYCSTRNGSPSMNGNGNGKATGKPCAGCVGKADNKNPKGQYPNGSDHNNGYECDGNHGIGRTNPAHTGCKTSTPPPCDSTTEDCGGGGGGCDSTTQDCGGGGGCDSTTE